MKIQLLASARDDLIDGFQFYEKKVTGLGDYFLSSLYSDIDSLKIFGGIHFKPYKNYHRALSKRFPFAIYYTLNDETVLVRAIVDSRKNPSWIRRRIEHSGPSAATDPTKQED